MQIKSQHNTTRKDASKEEREKVLTSSVTGVESSLYLGTGGGPRSVWTMAVMVVGSR